VSEVFFCRGISQFGIPQIRSKFSESGGSHPSSWNVRSLLGYPNFPLVLTFPIRKCRICRTAKREPSGVKKPSLLQTSRGIHVPPRMNSNSGHPSGSAGTNFYRWGSLIKKFYPKTVADVRPRVRITVQEKDPDFKFPGTSRCGKVFPRILGDPAVTWYTKFLSQKKFFIFPVQYLIVNFVLAIHPNAKVKIYYWAKSNDKI